ncbi:RNA polymerase sigma factor [Lysinibacter cavernae]|uniref:RNA polymerase sigma factor (Sigma-70 family) n=1 Tax=Lysinibacter cavernae TaxID=1640652 RepID=A0A7X5TT99_9MICO|nr:sigma-70 family RNA polymerase sigma factor [Lysinibacter cavernae]NIH54411.1 RNA polymerase sigma factor (sigma-70 family) [Lysinibacter cavernae]
MPFNEGSADEQHDSMALVAAYRNGDDSAAQALYAQYYSDALRTGIASAPNADIGEELASEAFVKVLETIRRGKGPTDNFKGYLRTTVRSLSADWYRKSAHYRDVSDMEEFTEHVPDVGDILDQGEGEIIAAYLRLDQRWRQIIFLKDIEGRKTAECARIMGLNPPAVSTLYTRARQGLRKEYLSELAVSLTAPNCKVWSSALALDTLGQLTGGKKRSLQAHLRGCSDCERVAIELRHRAEKFSSAKASSALLAVAGMMILPGLGLGSPRLASAASALAFGGSISTGLVAVAGVALLSAATISLVSAGAQSDEGSVVSLASRSAECTVSFESHKTGGNRGTFVANSSGLSECRVTYSVDGIVLIDSEYVDGTKAFAASRTGVYQIQITQDGQTASKSFIVK